MMILQSKRGRDDQAMIIFDCYRGAYGETLRIDVQSIDALRALAKLLTTFSNGPEEEQSMRILERTKFAPPLRDIRLQKSAKAATVIALATSTEQMELKWMQSQSEWEDTVSLVEGLEQIALQGKSAHQYLTQGKAGVLIELAFKE